MFQRQHTNDGKVLDHALGWVVGEVAGERYFGKQGGGLGFHGNVRIYPGHHLPAMIRHSLLLVAARVQLRGELVQASIRDCLPALVVNHRVAQDTVEPSDDGVADLVAPVEASHEGVLHDLLRERAVTDAPFDEAEKVPVIRDQDLRDLWRDGLFGARRLIVHDTCMARLPVICQANVRGVMRRRVPRRAL